MEHYKKAIDGQHAPEALIAKTLQRIHEEEKCMDRTESENDSPDARSAQVHVATQVVDFEQNKKKSKSKSKRLLRVLPVAAVAGLALVVSVLGGADELTYYPVEGTMIRDMNNSHIQQEMHVTEYEEYLGVELTAVAEGIALEDVEVAVVYDDSQENILEDEGTFFYDMNGKRVMLKVSKTSEVAPEELMQVEPSDWNGMVLYAGKGATTEQYMVALEREGIHYFITGYAMSEKEFESFLKKFF